MKNELSISETLLVIDLVIPFEHILGGGFVFTAFIITEYCIKDTRYD